MAKDNYYKTLGLEDYCDDEERIKEAYERLNRSRDELADDRVEKLDSAYEVLSDAGKKFLYDNDLKEDNDYTDRSTLVDISSDEGDGHSYLSDYSDEIGTIGYPEKKSSKGILKVLVIVIIVAVLIAAVSVFLNVRSGSKEVNEPAPEPVTEVDTGYEGLEEMYVSNGAVFVNPEDEAPCEITVRTSGTNDYYIYLKDLTHNGRNDTAFYVQGGEEATVNMALGSYQLYYASGDKWYGSKYKFGEKTVYATSDEVLEFTSSEENGQTYYDVWTIDLHPVENGNMTSDMISGDQFPG